MREQDNIAVFEDTLQQIKEKYPVDESKVRYYNGLSPIMARTYHPDITMIHGGTVNTGYANAENMRVAILNFADAIKYGGWVENGAQTQEENLCRCTNIYPILGNSKSHEMYYQPNWDSLCIERLPLDFCHYGRSDEVYTDRIIYIRDATVFKDDTTYANVEPRNLDVITCPAPSAYLGSDKAFSVYYLRVEQIILSAIENGANCIVLGAWGCGAFGQSPILVARAFGEALNKYGGYFRKIVFAIKPTPNWGERDLCDDFADVLETIYKGEVIYEE